MHFEYYKLCLNSAWTSGQSLDVFTGSCHSPFPVQTQHDSRQEVNKLRPLFRLANRLIQAARSSKLDQAGLREYLKGLKENYFKEVGSTAEEWSNEQQIPRTTLSTSSISSICW